MTGRPLGAGTSPQDEASPVGAAALQHGDAPAAAAATAPRRVPRTRRAGRGVRPGRGARTAPPRGARRSPSRAGGRREAARENAQARGGKGPAAGRGGAGRRLRGAGRRGGRRGRVGVARRGARPFLPVPAPLAVPAAAPTPTPPPPAAQKMASPCGRQQCSIERRGVRHQLDSWRHKLIHCVGEGRAARRGGRAGPRGGSGGGGGGEGGRGGSGGAAACGPSPALRAAARRAAPGRAPPFGGRAPPGGPALLCGPCQRRARSSPPGPAAAPSNLFTGGPGRARRRGAAAVSARAWGEAGGGKLRVGAGSRGSGLCDCFPPFCFPSFSVIFFPPRIFFPSHRARTLVSFFTYANAALSSP